MARPRTDDVTLKLPRPLVSSQSVAQEEDGLTHEEVTAIRRRLQALGYLED